MDELVQKLLGFPPFTPPQKPLTDQQYDEAITAQVKYAKSISDSKLVQSTASGESLLDVIKPETHSVPFAYVLLAHLSVVAKGNKAIDVNRLWSQMANLLGKGDPRQFMYIGQEILHIVDEVLKYSRNTKSSVAIAPIVDFLGRLDPSGALLTSTHILLAAHASETGDYASAVQVFDKSILYFPGSSSLPKPKYLCDTSLPPTSYITPSNGLTRKLKAIEVLDYFLATGVVYIGLGEWEKALDAVENAVTYPAQEGAISKIMVEAYKKWLLLSVLVDGKARPLPKSTTSAAAKEFHALSKPYEAVAQIFETGTAARLKSEVEVGARFWSQDYNHGLLLAILARYQQVQIKDLANVYSKISIQEVHNLTSSAEVGGKLPSAQDTEALVRHMITTGALNATLTTAPNGLPVLTFNAGISPIPEAEVQRQLLVATQRIQALTQEIKVTNQILTHDKDYLKYAQKQRKNQRSDSSFSPSLDWNAVEDEDLMDQGF